MVLLTIGSSVANAQLQPPETNSVEISLQIESDGLLLDFTRVDIWNQLPNRTKPVGNYFLAILGTIQSIDSNSDCIFQRDFLLNVGGTEYEVADEIKSLDDLYNSDYPGWFWGHCSENGAAETTFLLFDVSSGQNGVDLIVFEKSYRLSDSMSELTNSAEAPLPTPTPTATSTSTPTPTYTPTYTPAPISFSTESGTQSLVALPPGAPKSKLAVGAVSNAGLEFILQRIDFWESLPDKSKSNGGLFMVLLGTLRPTEESERRNECIKTGDFNLKISDKSIEMSDHADGVAEFYDTDYPGWLFSQCIKRDESVGTFFIFEVPDNLLQTGEAELIFRDASLWLGIIDEILQSSEVATPIPTSTGAPTRKPTQTSTPTSTAAPMLIPTIESATQTEAIQNDVQPQNFVTTTNANANLYDGPGDSNSAVAGTYEGDTITIVAVDSSGEWYQLDNGYWISASQTNRPNISTSQESAPAVSINSLDVSNSDEDLSYTIIQEDTLFETKRTLDIRMNQRVSEDQLRLIALELKDSDPITYERTFITYYLPGVELEAGPWATTNFNRDLKVQILGFTTEDVIQLTTQTAEDATRTVVGRWLHERQYIGNKVTVYSEAGRFYVRDDYLDGSSGTRELAEATSPEGRKFVDLECCGYGEYYLIDTNGDLEIWDEDGQVFSPIFTIGLGERTVEATITIPTPTVVQQVTPTSMPTLIPQLPTPTSTNIPTAAPTAPSNSSAIIVTEIVDGDTIKVQMNGMIQTIRYIGMDTPERGQPGYQAAKEANRILVEGQIVTLVRDRSDTDRNGRLLRYVYLQNGVMVNQQLVALGVAQPVEYAPDTSQAATLLSAAITASQQRVGFWSGTSNYDGAPAYGITNQSMNIRSGPGTDFATSGSAATNTPLTIFGRDSSGDWVQVRPPNRKGGWIYAPYLTLNVNTASIAIANDIPQNRIAATAVPTAVYVAPAPQPNVVQQAPVNSLVAATAQPAPQQLAPQQLAPQQPAPVTVPSAGGGQPFVCIGGCSVAPDPSCSIKGNVNSEKEKIYHTTSSRSYTRTNVKPEEGDRWFCTTTEATNAGFRAPKN